MRAPTTSMSLTGTQSRAKPVKFLVVLIKDKGAPALVPAE